MTKTKIGIVGYGNLGRGVEGAIAQNDDLELVAVFTRRSPEKLQTASNAVVHHVDDVENFIGKIDVMIICGGSATDLPEQVPYFAQWFNTIDSYDTHAKIPAFYETVDQVAQQANTTSIVSVGWDPGLFSLNRVLGEAVLPQGDTYTFWGDGLSQGHSDAIRRISGVKKAVQYTLPVPAAVNRVRNGESPELSTREKHTRVCYIVTDDHASQSVITEAIITMPNYFADYDTTVNYITEEEFEENHTGMPHGGFVIRSGQSVEGHKQIMEFSLKLESNPYFTSSVLVAYARAAHRLAQKGQFGALSVFDVPFSAISPKTPQQLRAELL
ncbi:diaminopimelate dehydrogenase [Kurthia sibirica]|uniref:Meso-diaminopimelate D-dehydrogenase n=1 Tax=Kurthia sibirica TaxID=202750 RepID=A0A2U3AND6_9BACL|nr:diaminopimelate dehydrogenase [Kurthia sibirica]PWI26060.1 diaminopimelate dehydrogenase [Kurthia sibirica]GEK34789.1 meso-diaminopimelate D-dehydrogenase [Kurthia sibirica]